MPAAVGRAFQAVGTANTKALQWNEVEVFEKLEVSVTGGTED